MYVFFFFFYCSHKCPEDIHSPLMRGYTHLSHIHVFKENLLNSTTWPYKVHWTNYFRQANCSRNSTRILPEPAPIWPKYSPDFLKFAEIRRVCYIGRGGGTVSPSPVPYAYWNYLKFIEAVDMISLIHTTRICTEEFKIRKQPWLLRVLCVTSLPCSTLASSYFHWS